MRTIPRHRPRPRAAVAVLVTWCALLLGALVTLLPRPALAAGTVNLASREVTEEDGRWKLKMSIDFGSVPQLPHIPMIFSFEPKVLYERSLTDKSPEKPVLLRMPLSNQTSNNESMDVGFSDGSGKIFKITKFDFVIRRDHGFEAGEYDLKIKREDDGVQMGQVIHLTLKGDNAVVDRRAMVFAGDKPRKKVDPDKAEAAKADEKPEGTTEEKKSEEGEEKKTSEDVPKVPPKQGGCGCEVAGGEGPNGGAIAALGMAAALLLRRRRR
jgi:MYXO-CTERM domain-containing protein